jgi:hypothetical protein
MVISEASKKAKTVSPVGKPAKQSVHGGNKGLSVFGQFHKKSAHTIACIIGH